MKQKTICISDETFENLKSEENASQLIERLLREHWKTPGSEKADLLKKLEIIEEEKKKEQDRIILQVKEIEQIENQAVQDLEREQQKRDFKIRMCVKNAKEIFEVDITEAEAVEYIDGKYPTIADYLIAKGKWKDDNRERESSNNQDVQ